MSPPEINVTSTFEDIKNEVVNDNLVCASQKLSSLARDYYSGEHSIALDVWRRAKVSDLDKRSGVKSSEEISQERSRITKTILGSLTHIEEAFDGNKIALFSGSGSLSEPTSQKINTSHKIDESKGPRAVIAVNLVSNVDKLKLIKRLQPTKKKESFLISLKSVSYSYEEGQNVLANIDFTLGQREIVSLIGENGAGKSTFLALLAGRIKPSSGEIEYSSDLFIDKTTTNRIGIFLLSPSPAKWGGSVIQSLTRIAIGVHGPQEQAYLEVMDAILRYDLSDVQHRSFNHLSTGQLLRVELAKVQILQPKVVLLDEPFANLSPLGRLSFLNFLVETVSRANLPVSVVLISHLHTELDSICDQYLFLDVESKSFKDLEDSKGSLFRIRLESNNIYSEMELLVTRLLEASLVGDKVVRFRTDAASFMIKTASNLERKVLWPIVADLFANRLVGVEDLSKTAAFWNSEVRSDWQTYG